MILKTKMTLIRNFIQSIVILKTRVNKNFNLKAKIMMFWQQRSKKRKCLKN
jgi:hypothetical protein